MILTCKEYFTSVNYGMPVGETINMPVENNTFPDQIGIFKVITPFYIIAYIVSDDYFVRIARQIYVGQDIHITAK